MPEEKRLSRREITYLAVFSMTMFPYWLSFARVDFSPFFNLPGGGNAGGKNSQIAG
jgi:hypothetical protein